MQYQDDHNAHLLSRRALLRGAAGLGVTAATGTLLPACGWGGAEDDEAGALERDAPLETTSIRLYQAPPAKGADVVDKDPEGSARFVVDRGYTTNFDYTCDLLKEVPYDAWRVYDPVDSVRFYALRLKEAGIIDSPLSRSSNEGRISGTSHSCNKN